METRSRRQMKEVLGSSNWGRYWQLALAYGIGMAYRRVEFTTRLDQRGKGGPDAWLIQRALVPYDKNEVLADLKKAVAEIQVWLDTPATPELEARHKAARDKFMEEKAIRRIKIQVAVAETKAFREKWAKDHAAE